MPGDALGTEMTEDLADESGPPQEGGIGPQLRAAREARGLSLAQLAAETRIAQRHLQTIEAGEFSELAARTYAIGFSRTYARAVGLDDVHVAERVRAEMDELDVEPRPRVAGFEPGDPARVPSRSLGWLSVVAVVLVLAGLFFAARSFFSPAAELPSLIEREEVEPPEQAAASPGSAGRQVAASAGPVVFTALDEVWVRFYTSEGSLAEMLMAPGDTYTVPADASQPMLRTGRPDALRITVGGQQVPKIAEVQQVMTDVPVTAEALLARGRRDAANGPPPSPTA